jgi:hypothetical protein
VSFVGFQLGLFLGRDQLGLLFLGGGIGHPSAPPVEDGECEYVVEDLEPGFWIRLIHRAGDLAQDALVASAEPA